MRKFLILATVLLLTLPVFAVETIFKGHDRSTTCVRVSDIYTVANYCDSDKIIELNGYRGCNMHYKSRETCEADYASFEKLMRQGMLYDRCIKYGGGNACRKYL